LLALLGNALSTNRGDTWSDVSKAGIQIAVITVLSAVVTASFRYIDDVRARDEQRRQVFRDVLETYNEIKAVRRSLRALGIAHFDSSTRLTAVTAQGIREQMALLNQAQLRLETIARVLTESGLFTQVAEVVTQLRIAERYINKSVIDRWEEHGDTIAEGATRSAIEPLDLQRFIGHESDGSQFEECLSTPLDTIRDIIHDELFGSRGERKARS
jgi:hypothetical protein